MTLTPVTFEILLALAGGETHGYAILKDVERRTGGELSLHPGTLYRALARLVEEGLVEETEERPDPPLDDERRRYYRLTEGGRDAAAREAARLAQQVAAARARRLLEEGSG